jgi:hypothetical protein
LEVVDCVKAARAFYDFGSASQHFFGEGGKIGAMNERKEKLNREIRQIRERGGAEIVGLLAGRGSGVNVHPG